MTNRELEHLKSKKAEELEPIVNKARKKVEEFQLDPRDVNYWINDNEEINKLAAYGGFQKRYPHWRWGMKYDRQQKQGEYTQSKIFEMVINNDPCHAYLQVSNDEVIQKAVIAHVEAHSDFFKNNRWFQDFPDAVETLSNHAERIESYMNDADVSREEVEAWIDNILCLEDNIDQYSDYVFHEDVGEDEDSVEVEMEDKVKSLNLDPEVEKSVFGDTIEKSPAPKEISYEDEETEDILLFLIKNGQQNDMVSGSKDYEDWQRDILAMLREEFYLFSPQKMTKIMNEGWASYIESLVMTDEGFADADGIIDYADQHSKVIASRGLNPYRLGKGLWEHIENTVNRREVVDKLLRVENITPDNFHKKVDFDQVQIILSEKDSGDAIVRNYSLTRRHNKGFIKSISLENLRKINRYIVDTNCYSSIEEALSEVDKKRGWKRILEVRETHNDVMFIDEFLTQKFVEDNNYFTYEYRVADDMSEVSSKDVEDVKKKLLLQLTNFGKPKVVVGSGNYHNSSELLLIHKYNGIVLDLKKTKKTLKRLYEMWGHPVNLATVGKRISEEELDYAYSEGVEPIPEEIHVVIGYDGEEFTEEVNENGPLITAVEATDVDYNTKPDDWL